MTSEREELGNELLRSAHSKVVGAQQVRRVLEGKTAKAVFIAADADKSMTGPLSALCGQMGVTVYEVSTMKELGSAAGIAVGAAAVAIVENGSRE